MVWELRIKNVVEAVLLTTETAPELKVINRLEIDMPNMGIDGITPAMKLKTVE